MRYWRTGLQEIYFSLSKKAYVKSMQKLVPSVGVGDLEKWGSGVRAQAILPDGTLVDDFVIKETRNAVHGDQRAVSRGHVLSFYWRVRHGPGRFHF